MPDINLSSFIWSVADLLRGDFRQSDHGKVILPFTLLRRLDCVLESTKVAVLEVSKKCGKQKLPPELVLPGVAKQSFYNASPLDLTRVLGDQDNIAANLRSYIKGFSPFALRDGGSLPSSSVRTQWPNADLNWS